MSRPLCPNQQAELDRIKAERTRAFAERAKRELRTLAVNLTAFDGIDGHFDMAVQVDRRQLVIQALKETLSELENTAC